jgi:hypothetical protein
MQFQEIAYRRCGVIGIVSAIGDPRMADPFVPCTTGSRARRKCARWLAKLAPMP